MNYLLTKVRPIAKFQNRIVITLIFIFVGFATLNAQTKKWVFNANKMGSPFTMTIIEEDSAKVALFNQQCIALVDSLVHIISDYDSTSELSVVNKHAGVKPMPISPFLEHILIIGKDASKQTKGAYTIAIGPLSLLWRNARKSKIFPEKEAVLEAKKFISADDIILDSLYHTAYLKYKGMRIDLGSLGKGYVAQYIVNYLKQNGLDNCLVNAGGKIVTSKPKNDSTTWTVGINVPRSFKDILPKTLKFRNKAVATSGDLFQFFEKEGIRYSHIINPETGYGITTPKNVTAIASDGLIADWLSTACSILSIKDAKKLALKNHAELLISILKDNKVEIYKTKGFDNYFNE